MKEINGQISFLPSHDGCNIEIHDKDAAITFVRIQLNQEQLCQMMSRLAHTHCQKTIIYGIDKVGKKHECKKYDFELPDDYNKYKDKNKSILKKLGIDNCPKGWKPDLGFNSQDSFFKKDGKSFARMIIRRWVDKESNDV